MEGNRISSCVEKPRFSGYPESQILHLLLPAVFMTKRSLVKPRRKKAVRSEARV